jgi:predicted nucleic acid-binding protein
VVVVLYDCEFVWLARDLSLPLVTADKKVLNAFSGFAVMPDIFIKNVVL